LLKLKRIEMQGFKSFCDRTELRFAGVGIAAVVGPNGCGKSNVSDAISWVLGEQSAKSLRGSRMEDVIFAGTRERKPLGMAQVTLTLVDPQGRTTIPGLKPEHAHPAVSAPSGEGSGPANGNEAAPSNGHTNGHHAQPEPQEVTITRRLFRSGESEYLINGKHARLRDIQDLFMGTGLGPESYAIIEQGRIGQILSSKPLDRRSVIEEAAGIGRFKAKRRLAEAKLEGAKQNLDRVFDILEEVSRQVNSLKRQAAKARRYGELKTELDQALKNALTGRYQLMEREAARVALELNLAAKHFSELNEQVEAGEASLREARQQLYRTEAALAAARKQLSDLQLDAERTRGQLESQSRQIADIDQRLEQGAADNAEMEKRLAQLDTEHTGLAGALAELSQNAAAARERLAAKNAERESLNARLNAKEQALESARQLVVRLVGEASSLRSETGQLETFLAAMERDTARVANDEHSAASDLERLAARREELSQRLAAQQLQLESIGDRRKRVDEELASRKAAALETRQALDAQRGDLSHVKARRDSLEEILSHRAYTAESVKRLFTAVSRGEAQDLKPAGVLADFVELNDPQFEKAAEEFLHDELEYVVVRDWDEARRGVELLRTDLDGRATFLVEGGLMSQNGQMREASPVVPEPALSSETGVVGRLSDGLRFTNGLTHTPPALLPRLGRCFLADTRENAQQLAVRHPDFYFLLPDGVCYHGHAVSGGRKTGSGPLALKRELRELTTQVHSRSKVLTETEQHLQALDAAVQTLEADLEQLRTQQQLQEKDVLALDHETRKVSEEYNRASQRISVARLELDRLRREAADARQELAAKQALTVAKEQTRSEHERAFEQGRADAEQLRADAMHLAEEHSIVRVEVAGLEERRRGQESALERVAALSRDVRQRQQELTREIEQLSEARVRLLEEGLQLEARASRLAEEIERARVVGAELAEEEESQRSGLVLGEESLKQLRLHAAEAQEQRSQVELDLVRRQSDLEHLNESSHRDLGASVQELMTAGDAIADESVVAQAEEKAAELRKRIEALGPVNPEALTEYQEAQTRYEFLNTQRQDLLDSIRDTEKAIQEIDVESKKRFRVAFAVINENFKAMFQTLFGGGTGEMRLTGDGDVLDAGIEIVAQPPGKRLQNVLLLSGGEKALTAISLLMGIFKYQPSPFCILDEVDAPLDEANVARFTRLIQGMAEQTQFIIITHAKKTMESAQAMYGVTMQEQGVSKLVSVRFQGVAPPPLSQVQTELALA
jgi:chromosome segregation protein